MAANFAAWTLGDMFCSVTMNMMPSATGGSGFGMGSLIQGMAYIAGAILIGTSLMHLIRHYDGDKQAPLYQIFARMLGGSGLIALPAMIQWLFNTLALQSEGSGIYSTTACTGSIGDHSPTAVDWINGTTGGLDVLVTNLVYSIMDPITLFLSILAVIVGMVLVYKGLVKASKYGTDPRTYSVPSILVNLVIGAILITVGTSLDMDMNTIFGTGVKGSSWFWTSFGGGYLATTIIASGGSLDVFESTITAALTFFQIIGFISFIRGWLILKNSVEGTGQATMAQGLTHIFGGALAINIYYILNVLDYTFGTGFLS